MLSRAHRLTDPDSFRVAVRQGRRAGTSRLVVHLWHDGGPDPARVGFVVSKAVGPAVIRNRVKRRLRHIAREIITDLPGSAVLVVRANPAAAEATFEELSADLGRCVQRVMS